MQNPFFLTNVSATLPIEGSHLVAGYAYNTERQQAQYVSFEERSGNWHGVRVFDNELAALADTYDRFSRLAPAVFSENTSNLRRGANESPANYVARVKVQINSLALHR